MYGWLWRRLPGGTAAKAISMGLIVALAAVALWVLVFPWASIHLPFDRVGLSG
jgi:hypothetical protein